MSPRRNNRAALLEGAIRCLQERGYADTRARDVAEAAGANLASIGYHFGSTKEMMTEALIECYKRWLAEFGATIGSLPNLSPKERVDRSARMLAEGLEENRELALAFLDAVARAPRSEALRSVLAESYAVTRQAVVAMFDLPQNDQGSALASLLIAAFDGMLIQWVLDPDSTPDGALLTQALQQIKELD